MRKQKGFTMPGTIIFLILLTFLYTKQICCLQIKILYRNRTKILLDELLNRSITDIKKTYSKKKKKVRFSFSMKRRSEWKLCL